MTPELARSAILLIGWPGLTIGAVWTIVQAYDFYRSVRKSVYGRLVLLTALGWLTTMYGLAIVSTSYLFVDVQSAVWVVGPVFVVWGASMLIVALVVRRWNRSAVALNDLYLHLDELVKERTATLEEEREKAHNLNVVLEQRVQKQTAELEEKIRLLMNLGREQEGREKKMQEMMKRLDELVKEMDDEKAEPKTHAKRSSSA